MKYWFGVQWGQSYLMGEGASLAMVDHPSSDVIMIKNTLWDGCFITLTSLVPHLFLLGLLKLNLILFLDQLRLAWGDERWW